MLKGGDGACLPHASSAGGTIQMEIIEKWHVMVVNSYYYICKTQRVIFDRFSARFKYQASRLSGKRGDR